MATRKITVQIELDDKFTEGTQRIKGELQGLNSGLSKLKVVAGVTAAGIAAVTAALYATQRALSKTLHEAGEYELQLAKLNAILKSTGGAAGLTTQEMQNLASEMQKVTTYSDTIVLRAEAVLATFTRIGRDVFPMALKASADMAAVMGTDLQSAIVMLGKALNDPIIGLTALRRVGVSFTQEQTDLIKALTEEGNLLEAQKLILQEVKKEFGGAAEAMGQTYAGQVERLKNAFSDIYKNAGLIIAQQPEFKSGMEELVKVMADFANKIKESESLKNLGKDLGDLFKAIADNLDSFTEFVDLWARLAGYAAKFGRWLIEASAATGGGGTTQKLGFAADVTRAAGAEIETEGPAFLKFFENLQLDTMSHFEEVREETNKTTETWNKLYTTMKKTVEVPETLHLRLQQNALDYDIIIQKLNDVEIQSDAMAVALERQHQAHLQAVKDTVALLDAVTDITEELSNALVSIMDGVAVDWEDMLNRMLKALEEWIIEVMVRMAVLEAVNLALGGGLGTGQIFQMATGLSMSVPTPTPTPTAGVSWNIEIYNATPDTYVKVFQNLPMSARIKIRESLI